MKKNKPQPMNFSFFAKSIAEALNSLFFTDNRDFVRLKNFIAA